MTERINVSDLPSYFTKTVESTYLLRTLQEAATQENRKRYYEVQLLDATGTVRGKIWQENMSTDHKKMTGSVVNVKGLVIQSQSGTYQLLIRSMEKAKEYEMSDYVRGLTEEEGKNYKNILMKYVQSIKHEGYRKLTAEIFNSIPDLVSLPATLTGHHNYNGGYLVYTISVTCLVNHIIKSLSTYDRHPEHSIGYQPDVLTSAALLHAVGTAGMLTPYPDSRRVASSIPLSAYDMTLRKVSETAAMHPEFGIDDLDLSLLLHVIGCVYAEEERKPMLREALVLKKAVELQTGISMLDHFLAVNADKEGAIYDNTLGNYLYVQPEKKKEESHE